MSHLTSSFALAILCLGLGEQQAPNSLALLQYYYHTANQARWLQLYKTCRREVHLLVLCKKPSSCMVNP